MRAVWHDHRILIDFIALISGETFKLWSSSLCNFTPTSCHFLFLRSRYSPHHPRSMFLPSRKVHTHVKQQIQLYFRIFQPQNVTACISIIKPHLLTTIHLLAPAIHFFHAPPQKAQSPIQWVPGLFPRGKSGRGDHSPASNDRLRMSGAIPPFPHTASWRGNWLITGTILLYIYPRLPERTNATVKRLVSCLVCGRTQVRISAAHRPAVLKFQWFYSDPPDKCHNRTLK
jgi:hypothetical protein